MDDLYSDAMRSFQERFETRDLADRIATIGFRDTFNDADRAIIDTAMFFFMASVSADGQPQCSYKGGPRGFVRVTGPSELAFPLYEGNGLYLSAGNMAETGKVGLLFIDFEAQKRIRVNGIAQFVDDHPMLAEVRAAQLAVVVAVTDIHPNCPRNVHKMTFAETSGYTPVDATQDVGKAPWGKDRFGDVLPASMRPKEWDAEHE